MTEHALGQEYRIDKTAAQRAQDRYDGFGWRSRVGVQLRGAVAVVLGGEAELQNRTQ